MVTKLFIYSGSEQLFEFFSGRLVILLSFQCFSDLFEVLSHWIRWKIVGGMRICKGFVVLLSFGYAITYVESLLADLVEKKLRIFTIAIPYFFIWLWSRIHLHIKLLEQPFNEHSLQRMPKSCECWISLCLFICGFFGQLKALIVLYRKPFTKWKNRQVNMTQMGLL